MENVERVVSVMLWISAAGQVFDGGRQSANSGKMTGAVLGVFFAAASIFGACAVWP